MILSFLVGPTLGESSATAIKKLLKAGEEGLDLVQRYTHAEVEMSEAAAAHLRQRRTLRRPYWSSDRKRRRWRESPSGSTGLLLLPLSELWDT